MKKEDYVMKPGRSTDNYQSATSNVGTGHGVSANGNNISATAGSNKNDGFIFRNRFITQE
ncbi:hypothetical protein HRH25_15680 [Flavisolibacter sp. BT320]|nr:hypothetical protein [Flavisolibacter longurius]